MTVTAKPPRIRWTAGRDRIAHAVAGRSARSLCGEPAVEERLAWPAARKCMGCSALVAEAEAAR